jgi:hypothetical protein
MRFPALASRYDGDGRRLAFQILSAKQVMREPLKRDAPTADLRLLERASSRGPRRAAIPLPRESIRLSAPPSSTASASRE